MRNKLCYHRLPVQLWMVQKHLVLPGDSSPCLWSWCCSTHLKGSSPSLHLPMRQSGKSFQAPIATKCSAVLSAFLPVPNNEYIYIYTYYTYKIYFKHIKYIYICICLRRSMSMESHYTSLTRYCFSALLFMPFFLLTCQQEGIEERHQTAQLLLQVYPRHLLFVSFHPRLISHLTPS